MNRRYEQGVALITVLLVFALATIITSQVASRNYLDIRKTSNLINSKQAYHYALAGEQFARQLLHRDFKESDSPKSDQLTDNWANIDRIFDIDNGSMLIEITDQQGKFNLNNLINSNGQLNSASFLQFQSLLDNLNIDPDLAIELVDWMDDNTIAFKNGAEDKQYEKLNYLTANQAINDRSELRLLKSLSIQDYSKLKPYIVALPKVVNDKPISLTTYNLNTLDAKLIEILSDDANVSQISNRQRSGGYKNVNNWLNGEAKTLNTVKNQLSTNSNFFELTITAVYDDRKSVLRSQLFRDSTNGKITLLKRQQGIE